VANAPVTRLERFADALESACQRVGRVAAWLTLLLVLTTFAVVVLRYFFSVGWIWLQEASVYLHALVFLLGAAYTLGKDEHVRVDIFYRRLSERRRHMVDALGTLFLLLPSVVFIFWMSWGYVLRSWIGKEASRQTGGLPYPFPPLLKTAILVASLLLLLQGLAWIARYLRGARESDGGA